MTTFDPIESNTGDASPLVLGVDSGRSKTIALVADQNGNIAGIGRAGNPTIPTTSREKTLGDVKAAVSKALTSSSSGHVLSAALGVAGVDWPDQIEPVVELISQAGISGPVEAFNDVFSGCYAAQATEGVCVVLASGTGTNAGLVQNGQQLWHYGAYARTAGAQHLARAALEQVFLASDGRGAATALTEVFLSAFGAPNVDALIRRESEHGLDIPTLFGLAPAVVSEAERNDPVARWLVERLSEELSGYVTALVNRFELGLTNVHVVLAGGMLRDDGLIPDLVIRQIRAQIPRVSFTRPQYEPAVGALLRAYQLADIEVDRGLLAQLDSTCPPPTFFAG